LRDRAAHSPLISPFPGFLKGSGQFDRVIARQKKIERTQPRMLDPQNDMQSAVDIADRRSPARRHHQLSNRYVSHTGIFANDLIKVFSKRTGLRLTIGDQSSPI